MGIENVSQMYALLVCHVFIKGLKQLEILNLNFCGQLTGNICKYIRQCHSLEVLQLSGLEKLTDESIELLLNDPMDHLTELDISHTSITDWSLKVIAKGQYNLCPHVKCMVLARLQHRPFSKC